MRGTPTEMRLRFAHICISILFPVWLYAGERVYVSGGIEHEGLFPTAGVSAVRSTPREKWAKIDHLSNTYLDLSLHYVNDSNSARFRELRVDARGELMQWPMPGYEPDFKGYG